MNSKQCRLPSRATSLLSKNALWMRASLLFALLFSVTVGAQTAVIDVREAHVRAPVPGQTVAAAFMTLYNTSDAARQLVAVKGDIAQTIEIHGHEHVDGMMRMRKLDNVSLPPHTAVAFKPGGLHVMLMGLKQPLASNQTVALTLVLDNGQQVSANLNVVDVMSETNASEHAHHH